MVTKSAQETKKIAGILAQEALKNSRGLVIALEGELGSGKTTFVQGFAAALGVKDNVLSPTFVLMKIYEVKPRNRMLKHFIHIDCYRLDSAKDLLHLGFHELLKDRDAIVLIEWADRVRRLIPRGAIRLRFLHGERSSQRVIQIFNFQ